MQLVYEEGMDLEFTKAKFPRKIKKQLKKIGKYPQLLWTLKIQNNKTADLHCILFGNPKII